MGPTRFSDRNMALLQRCHTHIEDDGSAVVHRRRTEFFVRRILTLKPQRLQGIEWDSWMYIHIPNVTVEYLSLLLCRQEVPGSNLWPKAGCPEIYSNFLFSSKQSLSVHCKTVNHCFLQQTFRFIIDNPLYRSILYNQRYILNVHNDIHLYIRSYTLTQQSKIGVEFLTAVFCYQNRPDRR